MTNSFNTSYKYDVPCIIDPKESNHKTTKKLSLFKKNSKNFDNEEQKEQKK